MVKSRPDPNTTTPRPPPPNGSAPANTASPPMLKSSASSVSGLMRRLPQRELPPWTDQRLCRATWAAVDAPTHAQLDRDIKRASHSDLWPVILSGPAGSGKSCIAALIFCGWPGEAIWLDWGRACRLITACYRDGTCEWISQTSDVETTRDEGWVLGRVRDAGLAVFDDMGSRAPTEAQAEAGLALLNARSGSPTVITSNLSMEQIGRIQDDRLASRLGAGLEIRLTGKDRRLNP